MSDKPSDAYLESCLQKMVAKGLCKYFPASAKTASFEVLDHKVMQGLSWSEMVILTVLLASERFRTKSITYFNHITVCCTNSVCKYVYSSFVFPLLLALQQNLSTCLLAESPRLHSWGPTWYFELSVDTKGLISGEKMLKMRVPVLLERQLTSAHYNPWGPPRYLYPVFTS